jgi:hypothetical protein
VITKQEAKKLATEYLRQRGWNDFVIGDDSMIEEDFGWIFHYQSAEFLSTGNIYESFIGNAPVLVDRENGAIQSTGTALEIDFFIKVYRKYREQILSGKLYYPALVRKLAHSYANGDYDLEGSDSEIASLLTD